jgi:CRISPR-associated protein Csd1
MGFWQGLYESYEKNENTLKRLYPLSTTTISNNSDFIAVIVLNKDGNLAKDKPYIIKKAKKNPKNSSEYIDPPESITIPISEKSSARSGGAIEPHPLFDQFDYLKGSGKKFKEYIAQLKEFAESDFATDAVKAIYAYVSRKSVENDLANLNPKSKTNVIFDVRISEKKTWEEEELFKSWHSFYMNSWHDFYINRQKELASKQKELKEKQKPKKLKKKLGLDYISGMEQLEANYHPKKIVNSSGNAKLISDNDTSNFTFRGIFENSEEAFSIGYESSQKAHQFLRYLIKERGISCDSQVIFSYTIGNVEDEDLPNPLNGSKSVFGAFTFKTCIKPESEKQIELRAKTGFDYSEALSKALHSFNGGNALIKHDKTAVVVLDAASTGRLSVTFYRELLKNEYLEKIANWHDSCKWHFKIFEDEQSFTIVEAPSVDKIIEAVYGKPRSGQDASYVKIKKQAREQIVHCIFDGEDIPTNYIFNAVHRVSNPLAITNKDGKFVQNDFETMLCTTCALVQKSNKEKSMSLEPDRKDRDYLYGRLLGAADKLESYALYKSEKERVTNAIRFMNAFSQKPYKIWKDIHEKINIYFQKGGFALSEIEKIMDMFNDRPGDYENNAPLNSSYLLGFYHERAEIGRMAKKHSENNLNQEEDKNV